MARETPPRVYLSLTGCLLLVAFACLALSVSSAFFSALVMTGAVAVVLAGWVVTRALGGIRGCSVGLAALGLALALGTLSTCDDGQRGRARLGKHVYVLRYSSTFDGDGHYRLDECNSFGLFCTGHDAHTFQTAWGPHPATLAVDEQARAVSVMLDGKIWFTYRPSP
jgi:hypothetical protein